MTDKLYNILNKPRVLKAEIRRMNGRIEDLRLNMLPSAIRYDTDKVQSSPSDPMLKFVEKLSECEEKKKQLQIDYVKARDIMLDYIDRLSDSAQKDIIQLRFMSERKFYQIADDIQYSESQTYRIYADAIEELESMIVNESK